MDASMTTPRENELRIAEQAAQWLEVLPEGTPEQQEAFADWLRESPRHVQEFLLMTALDRAADGIDPQRQLDVNEMLTESSKNVVALGPMTRPSATATSDSASPSSSATKPRSFVRWPWGLAAAAVLTLAVLGALFQQRDANRFATAIGEQRAVALADGSVIHLNTGSRVQARFSDTARDVQLLEGEALFKVERDPARPFRVRAGETVIQALGTQFNVRKLKRTTTVAVLEGAVQVIDASQDVTRLAAGEEARITPSGAVVRDPKPDVTQAIAWQQRRLVFRGTALSDIAAEFNRYNKTPQIEVQGTTARSKRFTGIFDADDPESLIQFLAQFEDLAFETGDSEFIIRSRE